MQAEAEGCCTERGVGGRRWGNVFVCVCARARARTCVCVFAHIIIRALYTGAHLYMVASVYNDT